MQDRTGPGNIGEENITLFGLSDTLVIIHTIWNDIKWNNITTVE